MSKHLISTALRDAIAVAGNNRCAYCMTQRSLIGQPLEIDHIIPSSRAGTSTQSNLCLACPNCNRHKAAKIEAVDPETSQIVPLFHPKRDRWQDHFAWSEDGVTVVGVTPVGRATIDALQMNNVNVVQTRHIWVAWGYHPPHE